MVLHTQPCAALPGILTGKAAISLKVNGSACNSRSTPEAVTPTREGKPWGPRLRSRIKGRRRSLESFSSEDITLCLLKFTFKEQE